MFYHGQGMYQWDTWYCIGEEDGLIHAFYIQMRRPDGERSQTEADSIGHATSANLLDWKECPVILPPEQPGHMGDLQSWTGSVICDGNRYCMAYTIRTSQEDGTARIQAIGMAESRDLYQWQKCKENPVITPDPRWYNTAENPAAHGIVDCRDLMMVKHPTKKGWFGVFATRIHTPEFQEGTVFAGAYTEDFVHWEQTPPLYQSEKNAYSVVEMPDLFYYEGKWYLTWLEDNQYGNRDIAEDHYSTNATLYAVSNNVEGPYFAPEDNILYSSMGYNAFSFRTVDRNGRKYALHSMGTRNQENEQRPLFGVLGFPKEVHVADGRLQYCFADLVRSKFPHTLLASPVLPERNICRNEYENLGNWCRTDNALIGEVRYSWCRYIFAAACSDFLFEADIRLMDCVAAGLCIRTDKRGHMNRWLGLTVMLDFEQQIVFCATVPRFQISDKRRMKIEQQKTYRLKVLAVGEFVEVYIDDVFLLQCLTYFAFDGYAGLMVDRGQAVFSNIILNGTDQ